MKTVVCHNTPVYTHTHTYIYMKPCYEGKQWKQIMLGTMQKEIDKVVYFQQSVKAMWIIGYNRTVNLDINRWTNVSWHDRDYEKLTLRGHKMTYAL